MAVTSRPPTVQPIGAVVHGSAVPLPLLPRDGRPERTVHHEEWAAAWNGSQEGDKNPVRRGTTAPLPSNSSVEGMPRTFLAIATDFINAN